jgi:electron transfer flavoprotein-quinone oxidoreductase
VFADCIILADGVNALLSKKAGLRGDFLPQQMILAAKEIIKLPKATIESRFNIKEDEGVAHLMLGEATDGIEGAGFLYTNRESLSVGVACHMDALIREKAKIHDLLERFKQIEWISEFIKGGTLKEYSAHLIPMIGFKERSKMVSNGILVAGDAAGLTLNNGFVLRGMDFAIASGGAAAETTIEAHSKGDFSIKTLLAYEERLKASFVLNDLKTFRNAKDVMKNRSLYTIYPTLLGGVFKEVFTVTGKPKKRTTSLLWNHLRHHKASTAFVKDLFKVGRSL